MQFTIENVEFYLMIIIRISGFLFTAPFFSIGNVPMKVRIGLAVFLSIICINLVDYEQLNYTGTIGFALIVVEEVIVGVILGFAANVCTYIMNFVGHIIDIDIGFSMVNLMDTATKIQTTISGNFYMYMIFLMMLVTNAHYYVIKAILDSFQYIPIGKAVLYRPLYQSFVQFMVDFFVIGFRIILPMFACILIINIVLGILARIAPQMNMFVIGLQLKVLVGLFVLTLMASMLPAVSDYIFTEMREMINYVMQGMSP